MDRIIPTKIFYVYEHWRPDKDVCFWVGKGKGRRAFGRRTHNKFYMNVLRKLEKRGMCVEVRMVQHGLSEKEAFELEIQRIAFWRARKVKLANVTNGGEGPSGRVWTKEELKRLAAAISAVRMGMVFSTSHCVNLSKAKLNRARKPFKKSTCKKIALAARRRRNTRPGTWTEDLVAVLELLHKQGYSSRQISTKMNLSRQTVTQKLYRLKLKLNPGIVESV